MASRVTSSNKAAVRGIVMRSTASLVQKLHISDKDMENLKSASQVILALIAVTGAVYEDVKEIGQWIADRYIDHTIYYVSFRAPDFIISGKPALVFYSNRFVDEASNLPDPNAGAPAVHRTRTHQVYIRNNTVYVVAVRFVP